MRNATDEPESRARNGLLASGISSALCYQVVHQHGIGWIRLEKTEDVRTLRANIAGVEHPVAGKLPLKSQVPVLTGRVSEITIEDRGEQK